MKIIILRHAEAVDLSQAGGSDRDRKLTARGEKQAALAGRMLKATGLIPGTIWSSPYPRAMQTARLAARQWEGEKDVQGIELLEPGVDAGDVIERIAATGPEEPLMLVGHNPDLEELTGTLISPDGKARVNLGKGAIAILETDGPAAQGRATLKGLWSSVQMKAMGNE